jgi:hypothetical protein
MTEQNFHKENAQGHAGSGTGDEEQVRLGVAAAPAAGAQSSALVDELRQVSPTLARLAQSSSQLSPEEWEKFADDLGREINVGTPPPRRTLRDKFSASENRLVRWLAFLVPAVR